MKKLLALTVLVVCLSPRTADAQLVLLDGLGYATVGFAAGATVGGLMAAATDASCDGFVCVPAVVAVPALAGMVLGAVVGGRIAGGAWEDVRAGRPARHLGYVAFGAVIGGAVPGLILGSFLVNSADANGDGSGTFLGSDERTLAITSVAGAGLSALYLRSQWDELNGRSLQVRPAMVAGHIGLRARMRF